VQRPGCGQIIFFFSTLKGPHSKTPSRKLTDLLAMQARACGTLQDDSYAGLHVSNILVCLEMQARAMSRGWPGAHASVGVSAITRTPQPQP